MNIYIIRESIIPGIWANIQLSAEERGGKKRKRPIQKKKTETEPITEAAGQNLYGKSMARIH